MTVKSRQLISLNENYVKARQGRTTTEKGETWGKSPKVRDVTFHRKSPQRGTVGLAGKEATWVD